MTNTISAAVSKIAGHPHNRPRTPRPRQSSLAQRNLAASDITLGGLPRLGRQSAAAMGVESMGAGATMADKRPEYHRAVRQQAPRLMSPRPAEFKRSTTRRDWTLGTGWRARIVARNVCRTAPRPDPTRYLKRQFRD